MNLDRFNCKIITENTMYFSDCSIWILSNRLFDIIHRLDIINEAFYRLFIIDDRKIPKNTNHERWLDFHYQSDSD